MCSTLDGIYPAVKLHGQGLVEIEEGLSSDAPMKLEPVQPVTLEGIWTVVSLGKDEKPATKVTMKVTHKSDRTYGLRLNIVNKFMGKLIEKSTSNWMGEISDKTVLQGTASETELEAKISQHISGIKNVAVDGVKNELRLESADFTSIWKRDVNQKTVTENPWTKTKN